MSSAHDRRDFGPARRCVLIALCSVGTACSNGARDRGADSAAVRGNSDHGNVVSRVDGVPIQARDVAQLAEVGGLAPRDALQRLESEHLLAAEAARRGYGADSETRLRARQALVQSMLEAEVEAVHNSDQELQAAYAAQLARFELPERREASHVLARLLEHASPAAEQAAHDFAREACKRLLASHDLSATLAELQHRGSDSQLFSVKVEALPLAPKLGAFVPEFAQALFSIAHPGVVPEPVRTQFGWHALVVTDIQPASSTPLSAARAVLDRELSERKRKQRFTELLANLQRNTPVRYSPEGAASLNTFEP
jgi:parvulin-like peptidyl-prolyl isomerase